MNDTVIYDDKPKREFVEIADLGNRFVAMLIDGFIVGAVTGVLSRFGAAGWGLSFVCSLVYSWYFLTHHNGQTIGKMIMHIRVMKTDGTPIDDATAIVRAVGYHISWAIFIGILWATWDDKKQGLHDKVANTLVVKA